jgi:hypothetical protein
MDLRRLLVVRDTVHSEGGLPALRPVTRVAAPLSPMRSPAAPTTTCPDSSGSANSSAACW